MEQLKGLVIGLLIGGLFTWSILFMMSIAVPVYPNGYMGIVVLPEYEYAVMDCENGMMVAAGHEEDWQVSYLELISNKLCREYRMKKAYTTNGFGTKLTLEKDNFGYALQIETAFSTERQYFGSNEKTAKDEFLWLATQFTWEDRKDQDRVKKQNDKLNKLMELFNSTDKELVTLKDIN